MMTSEDTPLSDIRIGQVSLEWARSQKIKAHYFQEIDSTNLKAKSESFSDETLAEQLLLYFADSQTAGRGRGANTWSTASPGSQLLSTWSFMLQDHVQPILTPLVGLALYKACTATWPFVSFNLKAPNDLYIREKKVAGLLLETVSQGEDIRLLVGLGLNVFSSPEKIPTATSLIKELPAGIPLLAEDWISFLERFIFEVSLAIQMAAEPLNTTARASLVSVLNLHPLLIEKYTDIDPEGTLLTKSSKINWLDL